MQRSAKAKFSLNLYFSMQIVECNRILCYIFDFKNDIIHIVIIRLIDFIEVDFIAIENTSNSKRVFMSINENSPALTVKIRFFKNLG